ncbi:carbohydrate-binding domain-containing protein [Microvirga arabica]|uniref:Carbohydrate-binding domain-containing protein n=1 Tax=Microvirga arabica TaxID=1128671 RepID=A0ABV6YDR4_9HYPH
MGTIIGTSASNIINGTSSVDLIKGLGGNDTIRGGDGDDRIHGGTGNDHLYGGAGGDTFVMDTALNGSTNVDRIFDFNGIHDDIELDQLIFKDLKIDGVLYQSMFAAGTAAKDANDRIIYNKATGELWYDADGTGSIAKVKFAQLNAGTELKANDIQINYAGVSMADPGGVVTPPPQPSSVGSVTTKIGTGTDKLVLKIAQNAYLGDAQYTIKVDGQQIGGILTAKALKGSGQSDTVEVSGNWPSGLHNVEVTFLNDAWGGTAQTDRNLYVESATYNGTAVSAAKLDLFDGSGTFQFRDSTATASTPMPVPGTGTPMDITRYDGAIKSSYAGQVIENLDIYLGRGDAVTITHDNVILRNCRIHHAEGIGVNVQGADGVKMSNVEVINTSPPSGINPETDENILNVQVENSQNFSASHVTVRDGSSGFYFLNSPGSKLDYVNGYNFHGPMPKGQFVQWDKSPNGSLTNFYVYNDPNKTYVEDNISVFGNSTNMLIKNGVIDGNNSETGVGVMFEYGSKGLVENVDAVHMGNGAFSSYSDGVTFRDVRSFDNWGGVGPRGENSSNSLIFNIQGAGVRYEEATYTNPTNPSNIAWDTSRAEYLDIREDRSAVVHDHRMWLNNFDWF